MRSNTPSAPRFVSHVKSVSTGLAAAMAKMRTTPSARIGLRHRGDPRRAGAAVDAAEERREHALAAEGESVAGDRVVEREERREEARGEEKRRGRAPDLTQPLGPRDEQHGRRVRGAVRLEAGLDERVRG